MEGRGFTRRGTVGQVGGGEWTFNIFACQVIPWPIHEQDKLTMSASSDISFVESGW
jgi:hypothetical protein